MEKLRNEIQINLPPLALSLLHSYKEQPEKINRFITQ